MNGRNLASLMTYIQIPDVLICDICNYCSSEAHHKLQTADWVIKIIIGINSKCDAEG